MTKVGDNGNSVRGASGRKGSRLRTAHSATPRHSARATRAAGQSMRSRLLDAASALFKARGLNGTSISAIAGASDAFPSQITYYFRTKEALFVEAACRDILHIAARAEKAAARARTPKAYAAALVDSVVGADEPAMALSTSPMFCATAPDLSVACSSSLAFLH